MRKHFLDDIVHSKSNSAASNLDGTSTGDIVMVTDLDSFFNACGSVCKRRYRNFIRLDTARISSSAQNHIVGMDLFAIKTS